MPKTAESEEVGYGATGPAQWLGRDMPQETCLSADCPLCLAELDAETLRTEMQKGSDDFAAGRVAELPDFRLELEREGRV